VTIRYHVTSASNRQSIAEHGLDWTRMTSTRGIAGSSVPEQEGAFLCDHDSDVDYFVRMNNTGGPVDIWSVDGVDDVELLDNGSGYFYFPGVIPPERLTLVHLDIDERPEASQITPLPPS
jgi:hypothetical protein